MTLHITCIEFSISNSTTGHTYRIVISSKYIISWFFNAVFIDNIYITIDGFTSYNSVIQAACFCTYHLNIDASNVAKFSQSKGGLCFIAAFQSDFYGIFASNKVFACINSSCKSKGPYLINAIPSKFNIRCSQSRFFRLADYFYIIGIWSFSWFSDAVGKFSAIFVGDGELNSISHNYISIFSFENLCIVYSGFNVFSFTSFGSINVERDLQVFIFHVNLIVLCSIHGESERNLTVSISGYLISRKVKAVLSFKGKFFTSTNNALSRVYGSSDFCSSNAICNKGISQISS